MAMTAMFLMRKTFTMTKVVLGVPFVILEKAKNVLTLKSLIKNFKDVIIVKGDTSDDLYSRY